MIAPEIIVTPSSDACMNLWRQFMSAAITDGRRGSHADTQIALCPNPYTWMQPRGKSCARWIPSAWYTTLLFPLLSVGALRNSSFLQFCTLIRWVSLFAIHPPFLLLRQEDPILEDYSEGGWETRTHMLWAKDLGVHLKHSSEHLVDSRVDGLRILKGCTVLCSALSPLLYPTAPVPDIFCLFFAVSHRNVPVPVQLP